MSNAPEDLPTHDGTDEFAVIAWLCKAVQFETSGEFELARHAYFTARDRVALRKNRDSNDEIALARLNIIYGLFLARAEGLESESFRVNRHALAKKAFSNAAKILETEIEYAHANNMRAKCRQLEQDYKSALQELLNLYQSHPSEYQPESAEARLIEARLEVIRAFENASPAPWETA